MDTLLLRENDKLDTHWIIRGTGRVRMVAIFTLIHPLVDACSFSVLLMGGMEWERVLVYNALAFALQYPLGLVLDARNGWCGMAFLIGTGLTAAAALAVAGGAGGWVALATACVGNALFHLSAGKRVLESCDGDSGPVGLFISTGALGLFAGRAGFLSGSGCWLWLFAAALAVCAGIAAWRWRMFPSPALVTLSQTCPESGADGRGVPSAGVPILAGLFVLIAWRSWAGLFAGHLTATGGILTALSGALATWGGKALGGYCAERWGRWRVTAASVCGSLALLFAVTPDHRAAWLALLFLSQMATGPVLSILYGRMRGKGGTAFGLNCLALFTGGLA